MEMETGYDNIVWVCVSVHQREREREREHKETRLFKIEAKKPSFYGGSWRG